MMGILSDVVIEAITNKVVSRISNLSTLPQPNLRPLVKGTVGAAVAMFDVPSASKTPAATFGLMAGLLAGAIVPGLAGVAAGIAVGVLSEYLGELAGFDDWKKLNFPPTHPGRWDPLVLDLNGDGVKLTPLAGSKVNFDFGADGFAEQTGWVSAQYGLVVFDRNKNGKIDNGTELFGNATEDGFAALAKFDLNKDGVIDSKDKIFADLRIWRDANGNGLTDAGELLTMAQAGIRNIKLAKKASGAELAGSILDFTGTFTRTNGKSGAAAAVSFAVNQTLTEWTSPAGFTPSDAAQKLPSLKGYGRLKDFAAAATENAALLRQAQDLATQASGTMAANKIVSAFDNLLYAWAGADRLEANSRGTLVDARKLAFLAAFFNDGFYDSGDVTSSRQADLDNSTYDSIRDSFLTRFLAGIPLSVWKSTGDEKQTFANLFLPLLQLGLADDNQFYGSFEDALADFFAAMPLDPIGGAKFSDIIKIGLAGARTEFDVSQEHFVDLVISSIARRQTRLADFRREVGYFDTASFRVTPLNGTITDTDASDNYIWTGGNATISDVDGRDRLILLGIAQSRLTWRVVGNDVAIIISGVSGSGAQSESILLQNQTVSGIQRVFAGDGQPLDWNDIRNASLTQRGTDASEKIVGSTVIWSYWNDTIFGMGGNDTIEGNNGYNLIDGGAGNDIIITRDQDDTVTGGLGNDRIRDDGGNDLIIYNRGDGDDTIENLWGEDIIKFGPGITKSQISYKLIGPDVLVTIAPSKTGGSDGGSILIRNQSDANQDIETLQFADGWTITADEVKTFALTLTGTAASEKLVGSSVYDYWNDTIDGAGGNDTLEGGSGDDSFVFAIGHGHDVVTDFDRDGNDELRISNKLFSSWNAVLKASKQVGDDVLITTSATSSIRLTNVLLSSFGSDDVRLVA